MGKCRCKKHGNFIGLDECPQCKLEEYIENRIVERTVHLINEINILRKRLGEV
jgi:hypothetical protein